MNESVPIVSETTGSDIRWDIWPEGLVSLEIISAGEALFRRMEFYELHSNYPYPRKKNKGENTLPPDQGGQGPDPWLGLVKSRYRSCSPTIASAFADVVQEIAGVPLRVKLAKGAQHSGIQNALVVEWNRITQSILKDPEKKHPYSLYLEKKGKVHLQTRGIIDILEEVGYGRAIDSAEEIMQGDILATKTKDGGHERVVNRIYDDPSNGKVTRWVEFISATFSKNSNSARGPKGDPAVRKQRWTLDYVKGLLKSKDQPLYIGRLEGTVCWDKATSTCSGYTPLNTGFNPEDFYQTYLKS